MAHKIIADSNTAVGYNFLTKEYYVENLDTKTTFVSPLGAKQILDVTSPFNTISEQDIYNLSQTLEDLTSIKYVWEDTGKYIKAIYFNDYKENAIIYDEPYLYIKGSIEMWNMSSSISRETIRDFFWSYYTYNYGLNVQVALMDTIIEYYNKIQSPYVYNNILPRKKIEDTLMYSNIFTTNNPDKSSRGEYTGTKNPDDVYSMDVYDVVKTGQVTEPVRYKIYSMKFVGSFIILDEIVSGLSSGMHILVKGTQNDGDYTIKEVDTITLQSSKQVTQIKTNEIFDEDFYSAEYYAYIQLDSTTTREENSVTITGEPMVKIGDIMQLRGAVNVNNLIVSGTEGNKILLKDSTPVGVHLESGNYLYASAYNINKIGYDDYTKVIGTMGVSKIAENVVSLSGWVYDTTFVEGQEVYVNYGQGTIKGPYTVQSVSPTVADASNALSGGTITINESPGNYTGTIGVEPVSIEVRNTTSIEEDSITVDLIVDLDEDETIEIKNTAEWDGEYIVERTETIGIDKTKIWLKRNDYFDGFKSWYKDSEQTKKGVVQLRNYSDRILLDMMYSKRADKIPTGKFMLDNDQQFTNYLMAYHIVHPTSTNYANLSQPVNLKYYLGENLDVEVMDCVGLYSEIFKA